MVAIPSHSPRSEASRHFPHFAWAGAIQNTRIPFSKHLWSVSLYGNGVASERASFFFLFPLILGYHCYHRKLGHGFSLFLPNLIMAGSWGGYFDCIYSTEG
jgi:hypothetical protein